MRRCPLCRRAEPGTGAINYRKVFEVLKELDYQGTIGFELYPKTDTASAVKAIKNVTEGLYGLSRNV